MAQEAQSNFDIHDSASQQSDAARHVQHPSNSSSEVSMAESGHYEGVVLNDNSTAVLGNVTHTHHYYNPLILSTSEAEIPPTDVEAFAADILQVVARYKHCIPDVPARKSTGSLEQWINDEIGPHLEPSVILEHLSTGSDSSDHISRISSHDTLRNIVSTAQSENSWPLVVTCATCNAEFSSRAAFYQHMAFADRLRCPYQSQSRQILTNPFSISWSRVQKDLDSQARSNVQTHNPLLASLCLPLVRRLAEVD